MREILMEPKLLAGRDQRCSQVGINAVATKLNNAHREVAALVQIGGKFMEDIIGVLSLRIDQSGEVALGIEHDPSLSYVAAELVNDYPAGPRGLRSSLGPPALRRCIF